MRVADEQTGSNLHLWRDVSHIIVIRLSASSFDSDTVDPIDAHLASGYYCLRRCLTLLILNKPTMKSLSQLDES